MAAKALEGAVAAALAQGDLVAARAAAKALLAYVEALPASPTGKADSARGGQRSA